MSHWVYKDKKVSNIPEGEPFGFVYRIVNTIDGRFYIGRKQFYNTRRKKIPGKVRRKVTVTESNWKSYTGSSKTLNADIDLLGKEKFSFEVLGFAYTKGQLNYLEEHVQFVTKALISDRCYNDSIGNKKFMSIRIDENFRNSLKNLEV